MFKEIKNDILSLICRNNYKKKIKQIQKYIPNKKIRVLFYVTENSKWGYQSLYEEFEKDNLFEPTIVVSILNEVHKGKDTTRSILDENYNFFKSKGMNVEYGYENHKYIDLKTFEPDIVFYEQPWGLPNKHKPQSVSKFALTFLSPYSFQIFDYKNDYKQNFHKLLYKYLVTTDINIERFEKYHKGNSKNCLNTNYMKMDTYFDNKNIDINAIWETPDNTKIIYAPHFSFMSGSINVSTFLENGQYILEQAKKLKDTTTWIFKPHPQLKHSLIENNIMSLEEVNTYYEEWAKIGKVYEKGDYFDMFKTSDFMITDCCSFLGEYLLSGKPIIRPIKENSTPLNMLGQTITKGYYETHNNEELSNMIILLTNNENDFKKNIREKIIDEQQCFKEKGAIKVHKYIKNIINGDNE